MIVSTQKIYLYFFKKWKMLLLFQAGVRQLREIHFLEHFAKLLKITCHAFVSFALKNEVPDHIFLKSVDPSS